MVSLRGAYKVATKYSTRNMWIDSRPPSETTFPFVTLEYLVSCIKILAHEGKRFGPNAAFDAMHKVSMLRESSKYSGEYSNDYRV